MIERAKRRFEELVTDTLRRRQLTGVRRDKHLVDERQYVCTTLRNEGFTYKEIAEVMNRDHTSIIHLVLKRGKNV